MENAKKEPDGAKILSTLIRLYADQEGLNISFKTEEKKGENIKCESCCYPA